MSADEVDAANSDVAREIESWLANQTPPVRVDGAHDLELFTADLMDSYLVVLLVDHIEERFGVTLSDEDLGIESLATLNRIARLVLRLQREQLGAFAEGEGLQEFLG